MNFDVANFVVGVFFSLIGSIIAGLEFVSNFREKKKIKDEEKHFKHRISCSEELLAELCKYSDVQQKLQKVMEDDFDTVTLSNCDLKEMSSQCDRVRADLQGTVNTFKNIISTFDEMINAVLTKEMYLPKTSVSLAISMEEIKSKLQIKVKLFESHLSELSWETILFQGEVAIYFGGHGKKDKLQLDELKNELYSHTYKIYLEYIELCELIKVIFKKYEILISCLHSYAEHSKTKKDSY